MFKVSTYSDYSDEDIVVLLKQNDHEAFTELYNRHWRRLFVVAFNKLKDHEEAEELAQDIFANIWNRRHEIEIQTNFRAYLSVALKYKIIDFMAKVNHRDKFRSLTHANRLEDDSTQQWLSFEELRSRLDKLVNDLPEKCRIVYQLKNDGLSYKQIAFQMGISEKTVESHLGKATKTIRLKIKTFFYIFLF